MQYIKADVSTISIGMAASAAAHLLASGTKGKRFSLPHSKIMIHQPHSGNRGTITDMEIDLKEGLSLKHLLEEILAKNTGKSQKQIHEDMERDYYMSAQEAKKYGIIDGVILKPPTPKNS
jgi:ATP-dependent Clp protease, protease subunit